MRESQEARLRYSGGSYCMSEAWPVYKSGRLVLAWRGLMASGGSFPRGVESNQCLLFFQRSPECILYVLKCQILSYLKSYRLRLRPRLDYFCLMSMGGRVLTPHSRVQIGTCPKAYSLKKVDIFL